MRIALLHNPKAGNGTFRVSKFVRQIEKAGHKVVYVSIKQNDWQDVFAEPIDRVIIAGGDGSVSRAAPWLRVRDLPSVSSRSARQTIAPEVSANCRLSNISLPMYIRPRFEGSTLVSSSPAGQRFFIESAGVGLLPRFMSAMRAAQKKNGSKLRSLSRERLGKAKEYFGKWAREAPDFDCQLLLHDEPENGEFLLLEVANIGRIGPRLDLAPGAEPGDGYLDVVWVRREQRKERLSYLKQLKKNGQTAAPVEHQRLIEIDQLQCERGDRDATWRGHFIKDFSIHVQRNSRAAEGNLSTPAIALMGHLPSVFGSSRNTQRKVNRIGIGQGVYYLVTVL